MFYRKGIEFGTETIIFACLFGSIQFLIFFFEKSEHISTEHMFAVS